MRVFLRISAWIRLLDLEATYDGVPRIIKGFGIKVVATSAT